MAAAVLSAGADIVWLRDDFRLDDQPAILAAADRPALHVYVHDNSPRNGRPLGGAAKWRLAQSLKAMEERLAPRGARLDVMRGDADKIILALAAAANAGRVLWTRRYEGASIALDAGVKTRLRERGVEALSFNGRLMREPWEVAKPDGALSGSFSAFWRRHRALPSLPARRARLIASRPRPGPRMLRNASRSRRCALRRPNRTGRASLRSARPRAKRARSPRSRGSSTARSPAMRKAAT